MSLKPINEFDKVRQGEKFEGYAFTFCKAAFLVLIFQRFSLLALSGLATLFYLLASWRGVTRWRCWAKPPYVTLFWAAIFAWQLWYTFHPSHTDPPVMKPYLQNTSHLRIYCQYWPI